ncbi:MAG: hypothetical protein HOV79_12060 [Hamadaea sp.]|nr:hypothetical protein [Hamadaea sp.]
MSDSIQPAVQIGPAQTARSLAQGRVVGTVQVAWAAGPFRVRHATDADGNPILLCRTGGGLSQALAPRDGDDVAVVLHVEGHAGRVWISGWSHPIHDHAARAAALEFAAANPVSDLLDVGRGFELHHLDVAEVRVERCGEIVDVDLDEYIATRCP